MKSSTLAKINEQPWYSQGKCDDCLCNKDHTIKLVKRIEDDGIAFCEKHWADYTKAMRENGEIVEPFHMQ